jgi:RNA polymerase sigma factor (sigma-70 family)
MSRAGELRRGPNRSWMSGLYIDVERNTVVAEESDGADDRRTRDGFSAWVAPHWTAMAHLAVRLAGTADGEDVLQDALVLAWRKRDRYDASRGSARSWLLALVADQGQKRHRRVMRRAQTVEPPRAGAESRPERTVDLERAMARLSARQKLAVDLYYYLDLPVSEVATVMKCSEGTAKSTLADARNRLHDYLGDDFR